MFPSRLTICFTYTICGDSSGMLYLTFLIFLVKVAEVFYHPFKNFRVGAGLGEEKIGGAHPHTEDLYRLTASYDYHIGDFGLAPTIAVDFIDGHQAYVFGVALIRPF